MGNIWNKVIPLIIAIYLEGCAQTMYKIQEAPKDRDAQKQNIDSSQCYEDSKINMLSTILFCGVGAPVCRSIRDSRYEECMHSRGYKVKATD